MKVIDVIQRGLSVVGAMCLFSLMFCPKVATAEQGFPLSARVTQDHLDQQRGGFRLPNGLQLNLAVEVRSWTSLAGQTSYRFHSVAGPVRSGQDLSRVLQVGSPDSNQLTDSFDNFSGVVNLVQNTADNVAIRQLLQVNLQLANLTALKRSLAPWRMPQPVNGF